MLTWSMLAGRAMGDRATTRGARYGLLVAAVVVAALAGYVGYLLYPRFDLPSVAGAGLLALAAAAGFAAFFSPCSFPLLATLLARQTGAGQPPRVRLRRALLFAASLSVGAVAFVLLLGVLLAGAGRGLAGEITFTSTPGRSLRVVVGLGLVVLGLVQTERLRVNLRVAESAIHGLLSRPARLLHHHSVAWFALFGFGYLAAGFG
jgi:cytochrome c biogenesis protein CcdA